MVRGWLCVLGASCIWTLALPGTGATTLQEASLTHPGAILTAPPSRPDVGARYVFYLHGRIVQEQGRGAVSPDFGPYDYDGILRGFASEGFVVLSEIRPRGTSESTYADRIVRQIQILLDKGVPARRITVVGASMGGSITMAVSTRLIAPHIGYVFMASCGGETLERFGKDLHGEVLSIFEASDELAGSCTPVFARARGLGRHREVRLTTGLRHGFLYRPLPEWMGPAIRWVRERD